MTQKAMMAAGAAGLMLASALAGPVSAAIYVKIPGIPGDAEAQEPGVEPDEIDLRATGQAAAASKVNREFNIGMPPTARAQDSGEAREPYITIKLDEAVVTSNTANGHEAAHVVQQRGEGTQAAETDHEQWIDVLSWSQPAASADTARGSRLSGIRAPRSARAARAAVETRDAPGGAASGKRQHKPLVVTKPIDKASPLLVPVSAGAGALHVQAAMPGCEVGARYPHMLVGDDDVGKEVRLEGVTITECASEQFSLNYEHVKF